MPWCIMMEMSTATATIGWMPTQEPKRGRGRPAGPKEKQVVHTAIDARVVRALDAYMASFEYPPRLTDVAEQAFRLLLREKGWPIEGDPPPKRGHK